MQTSPYPVFLTGATASGKSAVALELAGLTGGEIVCADAYQLYRGLEILTAQPSAAERERVPHHLYGTVPVTEEMDAGKFATMAEAAVADIRSRGKVAIICGGSGLYVKSLTHGLSPLPTADGALRAKLDSLPVETLAAHLTELDPASAAQLNLKNPRHVMRALEICILTGQPASELKQSWQSARPGARGIFLDRDRDDLYARINTRTQHMVTAGVLAEVERVDPDALSGTAEKTLGLWEFRAVTEESMTLPEAVASVQQATRHYAKRQTSWFKREDILVRMPLNELDTPLAVARKIRKLFKL